MTSSQFQLLESLLSDADVRNILEGWCERRELKIEDIMNYDKLNELVVANGFDAKSFLAELANDSFKRKDYIECLDLYNLCSRTDGDFLVPAGIVRRLGEIFFESDDVSNSIRSFELLSVLQPKIRTPRIILASLYFRKAISILDSGSGEDAFSLIAKSYTYRSETFELLRIYVSKADLHQHLSRPAKVADVENVALTLCEASENHFLSLLSRVHPLFYRFLRSILNFTNQQPKLLLFERLWLESALVSARKHLKSGNFDVASNICNFAIDLHPKIVLTEYISPFYAIMAEVLEEKGRSSEALINSKLAISSYTSSYYYKPADVLENVKRIEKNNVIILTYVSNMYFPIFEVWYAHCIRHSLTNILVIATDPLVHQKLIDLRINCLFEPLFAYQSDFIYGSDFCASRVRTLNEICRSGFDLLLCGVDSIFLKDPLPLVASFKSDIVAMGLTSQISNWPYNINADFLFIRSTSGSKQLLIRQLELQARLLSDQLAINQALAEYNATWEVGDSGEIVASCGELDLSVYLLPPSISCRRIEDLRETTIIYQPAGGFKGKVEALKQLNITS